MNNLIKHILLMALLFSMSCKVLAEVEPTSGRYYKEITDISVKVVGGMIEWKRLYEQGQWKFNESWAPLVFEIDSADGSTLRIIRGNDSYEKLDSAGTIYKFGPRLKLRKKSDGTGWSWADRDGNFMNYDLNGRPQNMGNKTGFTISFEYQNGKLIGVDAGNGIRILTVSYLGTSNYIDSVSDHSGRVIRYVWSDIDGNSNPVRKKLDVFTDVNEYDWTYEYDTNVNEDGFVNINQITDPENRATKIYYGSSGRVKKIIDPLNRATHYTFDYIKARKEYYIKTIYPGGRVKEKWYERDGDLKRKDVNGVSVTSFREDLRKEFITDIYGRSSTKEYDEFRNLVKVTYADGSFTSTTYDLSNSNILSHTNENGVTTKFTYIDDHLVSKTEALGTSVERTTNYTYDTFGQLKSIRKLGDANTEETFREIYYDGFGNVNKIIDEEMNEILYLDHNAIGKPLRIIDGNGYETKFSYNASGDMTSTTSPELNKITFVHDKVGNLIELINADNSTVKYEYDNLNRMIKETDELSFSKSYEYDMSGNITKYVDRDGNNVLIEYDSSNRAILQKDVLNNKIEMSYVDNNGNYLRSPTKIKFPTSTVFYKYDSRGRLIQEDLRYFKGSVEMIETVQYGFNPVGKLIYVNSDTEPVRKIEYDELNRVISSTSGNASQMKFEYDNRDNMIEVTDASNDKYTFTYDKLNNRITETTPSLETESHTYNANGNRVEYVDAKGQRRTYQFSKDYLLKTVKYYSTDNSLDRTIDFDYDNRGNLITYDDGISQGEFEYDIKNQKVREKTTLESIIFEHHYSYHPSGKKASYTDVEGVQYQFNYNEIGDLNNLVIPNEGNIKFDNYQFHMPQTIKYPGGIERTNSYDGSFKLQSFNVKTSENQNIVNRNYSFYSNGLVNQITNELGEYANYEYDDLQRLTSSEYPGFSNENFSYDLMGNRVTDDETGSDEWEYNQLNQLVDSIDYGYEYDVNGNLIKLKNLSSQSEETYTFNSQNNLSEVRNGSGQLLVTYYYDPFGRRLSKTVFDDNQSELVTYFHYNDEGYAAEKSAGEIKSFLFLPNNEWSTGPVLMRDGSNYYYYQNDHLGTPQIIHDNQGNVVNSKVIDAFGGWHNQVSLIADNFGFAGQYMDSETGFYYNLFRYYDSDSGRYISRDPIKFNGGMNMYLYANSSPTRFIDPMGLKVIGSWSPPPKLTNFNFSCHSGFDCADFGTGFNWMFAVNLKIEASAEITVGVKCEDTCTKEKWEASLPPFILDAEYQSQFELPFWCGLIAKGLKKMGAKNIHTATATAACWAALVTNLANAYPKVKNAVTNVLNNKAIPILSTLYEHGPETICIQNRD